MGNDEGQEEEGPLFAWLPPEDRLWRHPSEVGAAPGSGPEPDAIERAAGPGGHVWTVAMAAGVVGALVASALFVATGTLHSHTTKVFQPLQPPNSVLANTNKALPADSSPDWPQIANQLAPSVVSVSSSISGTSANNSGSGIIYSADMSGTDQTDIITASDLLTGGGAITVGFENGKTQPAKLVGADPATGIAVLSVPSDNYVGAPFGSVSQLSDATTVLALGTRVGNASPFATVTVNGLDESVVNQNDETVGGLLALGGGPISQTTDGGPIVDQAGSVVGIDSYAASSAASTGSASQSSAYAVPIDVARNVVDQLMADQKPTHPWLGIESATDVSTASTTRSGAVGGAQIDSVCPGPAMNAGLKPDDIVTAMDGRAVTSSGTLISMLAAATVGQWMKVSYVDKGSAFTTKMKVANQPAVVCES